MCTAHLNVSSGSRYLQCTALLLEAVGLPKIAQYLPTRFCKAHNCRIINTVSGTMYNIRRHLRDYIQHFKD